MSKSKNRPRPRNVWKLQAVPLIPTEHNAEIKIEHLTLLIRNDQPVARIYTNSDKVNSGLSVAHERDLGFHAERFYYVNRDRLLTYTANAMVMEGINRLIMHRMLTEMVFSRRDGDLATVRHHPQRGVSRLHGKPPEHPDVQAYLVEQGANEVYTSTGAWQRLDRPDWNSMDDEKIRRLGYGLSAWEVEDETIFLGGRNGAART